MVLEIVEPLRRRGDESIGEDEVIRGLRQVHWPARLEVLCRVPLQHLLRIWRLG